jgi:hypothetical protein
MKKAFLVATLSALPLGSLSCSVDFDDYVFDDDALEREQGGGTGGTQEVSECENFCQDSPATCPFGTNLGYASEAACLSLCAGYSAEQLECRIVHLRFAGDDPEVHCAHTLEDGGGTCPDARPAPCETFCLDSASTCPFGSANGYTDAEECRNLCEGYSAAELECRLVHLVFAEDDADGHCKHTLEDGGGVCPDATR